ncbi:hypothetical protein [Cognatilysobacter bugurensis]|uniref:Uncharacterized protein n=1 Tax=Cognatilysobacter bugurensis TaxID=543356 RepID=A0A918W830_9GAMM|nr:hypothetical protein [Lysobacter bugurensis]GHA76130.1 hypothetical protein GCM10007067_11680 [Lysobacter bugurensis]
MPHTLGFTGMDSATEAALQAAFAAANAELGGGWRLAPEHEAEFVVVDMDSMYGPMSWLRLHGSGRRVVGLTSGARTQTDFRLGRPIDTASVATMLRELSGQLPAAAETSAALEPSVPVPPPAPSSAPGGMTPAPQPFDQLPEEQPTHAAIEEAPPATEPLSVPSPGVTTPPDLEPPSTAVGQVLPAAPTIQPHVPTETGPRSLADWLRSGRLHGRVRFARGGVSVLINPDQQQYFGATSLKALAPLFEGPVDLDDFKPVDSGEWSTQSAALGAAQPLSRLAWYSALVSGKGKLLAGYDPAGRYQLLKWPQTEREFPKHFRIATVMMKGPTTLPELAEASGTPLEDVTDFVNANLATGFAEPFRESAPDPDANKGGLFGRLRGR